MQLVILNYKFMLFVAICPVRMEGLQLRWTTRINNGTVVELQVDVLDNFNHIERYCGLGKM